MAAQSVICVADGLSRSFTSQRLKNGRRMSPLLDWKEAKNTSTRATLREAHIDISSPAEYYRAFDSVTKGYTKLSIPQKGPERLCESFENLCEALKRLQ